MNMAIVISPEDDGMSLATVDTHLNSFNASISDTTIETSSSSGGKQSWLDQDFSVDRPVLDEGSECVMSFNADDEQTAVLRSTRNSWSNGNPVDTNLPRTSYTSVPVPKLAQDSTKRERQFAFESHSSPSSAQSQNVPQPNQHQDSQQEQPPGGLIRPIPLRIEDTIRALFEQPDTEDMTLTARATVQVAKQPQPQRSRAIKIRRPRPQADFEADARVMNQTLYDTATWRMYHRITEHRQRYPVDYDAMMDTEDSKHANTQSAPTQQVAFQNPHPAMQFVLQRPEMEGEIFHLEM